MRFDDRLATVLNQPAEDARDRAVRWRQLVDLVARSAGHEHSPAVGSALELIRSDAHLVSDELRAAAARAIAAPSLPLELLRYFVGEKLAVAAPVLAAAQLGDDQWRLLSADAQPEVQRFIATLRPGVDPQPAPEAPVAAATSRQAEAAPSISEVVARIERLRHAREQHSVPPPASTQEHSITHLPGGGTAALFRWECDPSGEIAWVEGAPRGALVGRSIARREGGEGVDEKVERAFAMRAPFRDAGLQLAGEGEAAGEWRISGIPAFTGGRFAGYRGVAVREAVRPVRALPSSRAASDPDSLRELVHELKTPLNAIIGFAEIIDAQLLGPADRPYRERASEIVGQARLLLAAIDDLDFTAKLQTNGDRQGQEAELNAVMYSLLGELRERAAARGATVELRPGATPAPCALDSTLADRLVRRFCRSAIDRVESGELLSFSVEQRSGVSRLAVTRPREPAHAQSPTFDLRLVRGLARIVGGDVTIESGWVVLSLPGA